MTHGKIGTDCARALARQLVGIPAWPRFTLDVRTSGEWGKRVGWLAVPLGQATRQGRL